MNAVAALEFRGVQRFVFGSFRLLDAVGRSALITHVTDPDQSEVRQLLDRHGCRFLGGGVSSLYVDAPDRASAQRFVADWTRLVRDDTDTAQITAAVIDIHETETVTPAQVSAALYAARSRDHISHQPALSAGFTTDCGVTGAPADSISTTRGVELLAGDVVRARQRAREWHADIDAALVDLHTPAAPAGQHRHWGVPLQLDLLSDNRGDSSRLSVIHLDIDGLGRRLRDYTNARPDSDQFTAANTARLCLRDWMQTLVWHLIGLIAASGQRVDDQERTVITGFPDRLSIALHGEQDLVWLPMRLVVAAGDDATLVCDHRLAWSLALAAMEWVGTDTTDLAETDPRRRLAGLGAPFDEPLTISIGIAEFPTGSPLSVAYERADAMTRHAKTRTGTSSVAWDIASPGAAQAIAAAHGAQHTATTGQPYDMDGLRYLLGDLLGPESGSLRSPGLSRGSVKQAALAGPAQLWRLLQGSRVPDAITREAEVRDGFELLDRHLHLSAQAGEQ